MKRSGQTILVIATRNAHKLAEMRVILGGNFECLSQDDFRGAPEVIEDAATFAGNATKKGTELARWLSTLQPATDQRLPDYVLADDSGLEVDALGGAPGVHSARFAALNPGQSGNSSTSENNAKLLHLLSSVPMEQRQARFRCVIALTPVLRERVESASPVCYADEFEMQTRLFEGTCEGRIVFEALGEGGFGYDPLFVPDGFDQTFAELGEEVKNRLSHRARALKQLKTAFLA